LGVQLRSHFHQFLPDVGRNRDRDPFPTAFRHGGILCRIHISGLGIDWNAPRNVFGSPLVYNDLPQFRQNFESPSTALPQLGQNFAAPAGDGGPCGATWVAPQLGQNFAFRGIIAAQLGQLFICPCIIPWPIWPPIAEPAPMPAPRPANTPAPPEGFLAASSIALPVWYCM